MLVKRAVAAVLLAGAVASVPIHSALAWRHHHGGLFFLPFAVAGAVVGTAAAIATAPFAALAGPPAYPAPYGYGPAPYPYAAPPAYGPGYYPPGYYSPYYSPYR
jgi:hypothetical protein